MFIEQEIAALCRVTQEANVQKFNLLPASEWPYLPRRILWPCPNTRVLPQGREGHELCNKSLGGWVGGQQAVAAVLACLTIIIIPQPGSSLLVAGLTALGASGSSVPRGAVQPHLKAQQWRSGAAGDKLQQLALFLL